MKAIILTSIEGQRGFKALVQKPQDSEQINTFAVNYSRLFPEAIKEVPGTPNGWRNILRAGYEHSVIYSPATGLYLMTEAIFNRLAQQESYQKDYRKDKVAHLRVELYPTDADIVKRLQTLNEPKASYVKRLIRADIKTDTEK